ncbi:MAG: transposase [Patescibacteria group bacterium]
MPNPRRVFAPGIPYHVISRGSGRSVVFRDPSDYETYLRILSEAKRRFKILIYHYVLMPNHVHLVLCATASNGSAFMRQLNLTYSLYSCRKRRKIGHVWKNRFKNIQIDSDAYLLACGNYIEMNPVRGRLVQSADEWPYSSFRHYATAEANPVVDGNPLYTEFGKTAKERCRRYVSWIGTTRR